MICMGKCQHFLHPVYETDTLSHLTHWTEWAASDCVSFSLRMHTVFLASHSHTTALSLSQPRQQSENGAGSGALPSAILWSCWLNIFWRIQFGKFSFDWISYTHMVNFLCRANFSCLCRSISSLETRKAAAFKYTNVGCLESVRLPFSLTQRAPGRGLCSPARKSFFPLPVWLAEWKSANIRFDLAVRVFVVLIAKYVAIYALCYIMSAMYLCCCIRETHFRTLWDRSAKAQRRHA